MEGEVQDSQGAFRHRWSYDTVGNRLSAETPITADGDTDAAIELESGKEMGGLVA